MKIKAFALMSALLVGTILAKADDLVPSPVSAAPATNTPAAAEMAPTATNTPLVVSSSTNAMPADSTNAIPKLWFPVGEELSYYIMWSGILVGRATILSSWGKEGDKPVIKITYWVQSNKALSRLYPVQDLIVTTVDPVTFRPIRFDMDMKEGKFRRKEITVFDYDTMTATWTSVTKKKTKTFAIEKDTRDLMTFMYFVRSQEFKKGEEKSWRVMADDEVYDLNAKVAAEEKVELPKYGKVRCLRVEPTAQFEGVFVRSGKMTLWLSSDERRLVTRVEAEVPVGSVQAVLNRVQGPGHDLWITKINPTNAPASGVPVNAGD